MANPAVAGTPLSLQSIYLRSGTIEMAKDFHPNLPGVPLLPLFRTAEGHCACNTTTFRTDDGPEQQALWCEFVSRFQFVYVRPKEDGAPHEEHEIEQHRLASISAEIAAHYNVNTDSFPDSEMLRQWASRNVMLHTWPYWREYCHNTMLRMGLPVTIIPLINIAFAPDSDDDTPPETALSAPPL